MNIVKGIGQGLMGIGLEKPEYKVVEKGEVKSYSVPFQILSYFRHKRPVRNYSLMQDFSPGSTPLF